MACPYDDPSKFLTVYVVYFGTINHPAGKYVVRGHHSVPGMLEPVPCEHADEFDRLEDAQLELVERGLVRMPKMPNDELCIVETWI